MKRPYYGNFTAEKERTETYLTAVRSLRDLDKAEGSPLRAYAESRWKEYRDMWAKQYGLKQSGGHACLTRLRRRCNGWNGCVKLIGSDHTSLWLKNGEPYVYVTQPYDLSHEDLVGMVTQCQELDLELRINAWPAWHFPGRVLMVEVRRQEKDHWPLSITE